MNTNLEARLRSLGARLLLKKLNESTAHLYVCKIKDGTEYIQGERLHLTSWGKWGPKETALKQPKQWWIDNVQPYSLSYCDLILAEES